MLFDVYRNNTLLTPRIYMRPQRVTKKDLVEASIAIGNILFMDLICDATDFLPGDVFVGENSIDRYVFSFKWPAKNNLGYRCDLPVTIQRPTQAEPNVNNVAPYGGQLTNTNLNLVYDAGTHLYSFSTGTATSVYCAKSRTGYGGPMPPSKLPLDVKESQWMFVMEILPGVTLKINDILIFEDEQYQVQAIDKQISGFRGQLLYCNLKRP